MRVLIYGINFAPEETGIGKYSGDMAAWLAEAGVEVRVICAPPYYPDWKIREGQAWPPYRVERWRGVDVYRVPVWVPRKPSGLKRIVHLASYALASIPSALAQLGWRPHVVFAVAPALTSAPVASLLARASGAKSWLHIQDFEVDVAFGMGMLKGGWLRRLVFGSERALLRSFDRVSSISGQMMRRLDAKGVDAARTRFFPNWADLRAIAPLTERSTYRDELGIADEVKVMLFSGTLGGKQGLMVIPAVAKRLRHRADLRFVICGAGPMLEPIKQACEGLPNVTLLPMQPYERLSQLLGMADIHLLPQSPEAADLVLPSKLSGMLASGRPIIATTNPGTEIADVVGRCGLVVPPEDDEALAAAIEQLAADPAQRAAFGAAARRYAESSIDREAVLQRVLEEMRALSAPAAVAI